MLPHLLPHDCAVSREQQGTVGNAERPRLRSFPAYARSTRNDRKQVNGGAGGIRTHERVAPLHTFQACAFDHSATAPHFRLEAAASNGLSVLSQAAALCQSVTHEKTLPRRPHLRPHLAVLRSVCAGRAGCVSIARRDRGTGACVRMGGDRAGGFAGNGAVGRS